MAGNPQVICLLLGVSMGVSAEDCPVAIDHALAELQAEVWGELHGEGYVRAREILGNLCREGSVTEDQWGNRVYSTAPVKSERIENYDSTHLDVYGVDVDLRESRKKKTPP